ncbi:prepilin peptidase [Parasulfuritortus cantonensis]|uniref:Prepilin peptidase n=1 Tax=Parasulfuritortus cantonensis TaxID=2528202 RepID=A0A4R1BKQ4_9PROT|nr:A24 family peptidase [Parasulfuritortus cantonensis]TCJ17981.1 prepilin peptidase [Parasulfuritortus cantonensis]
MLIAAVLVIWAGWLAVYDWRQRRLPNWLLLAGAALGGLYGLVSGAMPYGVRISDGAGTAVLALVVFWPAYRMGWMGAGDVKLCAVIGWLGGVKCLLGVLLGGSLLGGVYGLALMMRPTLADRLTVAELDLRLRRRIPYGAGMAVAFIGWNFVKVYTGVPMGT